MTPPVQESREDTELAARLSAALSVSPPPTEVPKAQDDAILLIARDKAREIKAGRRRLWTMLPAVAAAAAIAIAVWRWSGSGTDAMTVPSVVAADVNADGAVDILDALALARVIDTDRRLQPQWDLNADGAIDGSDVDWIARSAVSISQQDEQEDGSEDGR